MLRALYLIRNQAEHDSHWVPLIYALEAQMNVNLRPVQTVHSKYRGVSVHSYANKSIRIHYLNPSPGRHQVELFRAVVWIDDPALELWWLTNLTGVQELPLPEGMLEELDANFKGFLSWENVGR